MHQPTARRQAAMMAATSWLRSMNGCCCPAAGCADQAERARRFVRLWTLKEAYVKAVGRGIGARPGLRGFSVSLDHTDASEERLRLHLSWRFCSTCIVAKARMSN